MAKVGGSDLEKIILKGIMMSVYDKVEEKRIFLLFCILKCVSISGLRDVIVVTGLNPGKIWQSCHGNCS
jgi:hypothetical protein